MTSGQINALRDLLTEADSLNHLIDSLQQCMAKIGDADWLDVQISVYRGKLDSERTHAWIQPKWAAERVKKALLPVLEEAIQEARQKRADLHLPGEAV